MPQSNFDQKIEDSPLGGSVTRDGVTVQVHIYRFAGSGDEWTESG